MAEIANAKMFFFGGHQTWYKSYPWKFPDHSNDSPLGVADEYTPYLKSCLFFPTNSLNCSNLWNLPGYYCKFEGLIGPKKKKSAWSLALGKFMMTSLGLNWTFFTSLLSAYLTLGACGDRYKLACDVLEGFLFQHVVVDRICKNPLRVLNPSLE